MFQTDIFRQELKKKHSNRESKDEACVREEGVGQNPH